MTKTDILYSMPMMASARKWSRPTNAMPTRRPVGVRPCTAVMRRLMAHEWAVAAATAIAAVFRPHALQFAA